MDAIKSFGTAVSVGGTPILGLITASRSGADRNFIDVTTHASAGGYKEYLPGLKEGGSLELTGNFLPSDPGQILLRAGSDDVQAVILTFSDGTTIGFNGFIQPPNEDAQLDEAVGFSASIKVTGPLTYTPTAP